MQKKIILISLLLTSPFLHADKSGSRLEVRPGYFFFENSTLSNIYPCGGPQVQISGSYPLKNQFGFYASLGYMRAKGKSLNGGEKTCISQIPFDLGLQLTSKLTEKLRGNIAFGPRLFYVQQHTSSTHVDASLSRTSLGLFMNAQLNLLTSKNLFVGIFGECSYESASFSSLLPNVYGKNNVQVGGFSLGISLGYQF